MPVSVLGAFVTRSVTLTLQAGRPQGANGRDLLEARSQLRTTRELLPGFGKLLSARDIRYPRLASLPRNKMVNYLSFAILFAFAGEAFSCKRLEHCFYNEILLHTSFLHY